MKRTLVIILILCMALGNGYAQKTRITLEEALLQYDHDLSVLPCEHYSSGSMNCYDLHIYSGNKKGTATITIKATDGSNETCKFTVVVQ